MEAEDRIGSWTASQLSDYINGRMSAAESHRLEIDMLDDPFLNAAVEGFEQSGQAVDMRSLDEKWKASSEQSSAGGKTVLGSIAIGVGIVAVIGIVAMFIQQNEIELMAEEVGRSMEETRLQEQVYADSIEIMEIKLAQVIVAEKEIRPEATLEEQSAIQLQEQLEIVGERVDPPHTMEPLGFETPEDAASEKNIKEPRPEIFYLHDFKMADHRPEYDTEIYIRGEWMTGTAARYEREQEGIEQVPKIVQVNYEGILSDAMAYFAKRDYKASLLILKRMEKRHLNDANVAFYGGLCYYNLDKRSKADIYFRRALEHQNRVFYQEARWHLALSLLDQEKLERARYHLRIIIEEDEFYADRAQNLMREL